MKSKLYDPPAESKAKKNILFLHSSSELYGSDRSLLNILKEIDKSKYGIYVVLPCEGPLLEEIKKINNVNVEIFKIAVLRRKNLSFSGGIQYIKDFALSYGYIKNYINKNQIEIVDTNTSVVIPGAIAAKHLRKKSIWHIREIIKSKAENMIISQIMNRYADIVIANSKATAQAIKVKNTKIRVVYNAVDEQNNTERIPHNKFIIGMAGRINRGKGQKLFVDVAEIVHKKYPDVVFVVAGDAYAGEEYLKIELDNYIKEKSLENTVELLGQVDNMNEFYKTIDIFALPSIHPESFGLVIIEAMEYGLPVIATNHGGPTEIIENNKNGFLVDYKSPDEMAYRIIELIEDKQKCNEMGNLGQKMKREKYSVESMVNSIEKIFDYLEK